MTMDNIQTFQHLTGHTYLRIVGAYIINRESMNLQQGINEFMQQENMCNFQFLSL